MDLEVEMPQASKSYDSKNNAELIAHFQCLLIGTWVNDEELYWGERPLSYNVMPLPQVDPQATRPPDGPSNAPFKYGGFILKNFSFTETIRFNGSAVDGDLPDHTDPQALAVIAVAPNRGGAYTQFAHAVFYDQQVRFAEGPAAGTIVHVENGAWLHLGSREQLTGPYNMGPAIADGQVQRQPPYITIAKQIAVPHGNSVLALGSVDLYDKDKFHDDFEGLESNTIIPGAPVIPDAPVPYPQRADASTDSQIYKFMSVIGASEPPDIATAPQTDPYARELAANDDFENPKVEWALNPNVPLQIAIEKIKPTAHIHWRVTTDPLFGGEGVVTNIPFENRKSRVTEYWADYWLLTTDKYPTRSSTFDYLAYSQTILMEMDISLDGGETYRRYVFPHVTTNTVKKVPGTPTEARQKTLSALESSGPTSSGHRTKEHGRHGEEGHGKHGKKAG
jgi:hypothetical protein